MEEFFLQGILEPIPKGMLKKGFLQVLSILDHLFVVKRDDSKGLALRMDLNYNIEEFLPFFLHDINNMKLHIVKKIVFSQELWFEEERILSVVLLINHL